MPLAGNFQPPGTKPTIMSNHQQGTTQSSNDWGLKQVTTESNRPFMCFCMFHCDGILPSLWSSSATPLAFWVWAKEEETIQNQMVVVTWNKLVSCMMASWPTVTTHFRDRRLRPSKGLWKLAILSGQSAGCMTKGSLCDVILIRGGPPPWALVATCHMKAFTPILILVKLKPYIQRWRSAKSMYKYNLIKLREWIQQHHLKECKKQQQPNWSELGETSVLYRKKSGFHFGFVKISVFLISNLQCTTSS